MIADDPLEPLPQFTQNNLLEEGSLEDLPKIFPKTKFKIRTEQTDVGIDVYVELRSSKQTYTNSRFVVQVKSRQDSTTNLDGSYSKSIDNSNLFYLLRSANRAMYIFYVEETKTFFYEWADLFRDHLNRTKPNWKGQSSNSLRFHKRLDEAAVEDIYNDVNRRSNISHQRKEGLSTEIVIDSFHESGDHRNYDDIIWSFTQLINTFEGLSVLPGHILAKLPPFSTSARSRSYFNDFNYTLYTDNNFLFDFFQNVKLEGNNYVRVSDGALLPQDTMRQILLFLEYNFINHISRIRDHGDELRVCIHNLFLHQGCDCEHCSLKKLQWTNSIVKLNISIDENSVNHWLRRGIVLLEFGKIREAFELYKHFADESFSKRRYVAYIVAKFHLVSCGFLIRNAFHVNDSDAMMEEVSKIDLHLEIEKIGEQPEVKREVVKVLKWLVGTSYYLEMYVEMDLRFRESIKARDGDRRGRVVSTNHYQKVSTLSSELTVFIEGNAFHISYFNGLSLIILKVIEAGLIQQGLKNPMSIKISDLHPYFLHLCFTYCESEKLNDLFNKYKIERVSFGNEAEDPESDLLVYVNELLASIDGSRSFIIKEYAAGNAAPKKKFNSHLKIAMVLVSVADLSDTQLNEIVNRFIRIASSDIVEPGTVGGLRDIFVRRKSTIFPSTFVNCYRILISSKIFDRTTLINELPFYLKDAHPEFISSDPKTAEAIKSRITELVNMDEYQVYTLLSFCQIAVSETKDIIRLKLEDLLTRRFDTQVFYLAAYHGLISCEKFFDKLIEKVPRKEMAKKARQSIMGYDDFRNDDLDHVITLAYKYSLDLKRPEIQALADGVYYYQWLLNLDNFAYEMFDPYWLLYEPNIVFIQEFRKHDKIRLAVKEYLKKFQVSRLTDIYIEYLT